MITKLKLPFGLGHCLVAGRPFMPEGGRGCFEMERIGGKPGTNGKRDKDREIKEGKDDAGYHVAHEAAERLPAFPKLS